MRNCSDRNLEEGIGGMQTPVYCSSAEVAFVSSTAFSRYDVDLLVWVSKFRAGILGSAHRACANTHVRVASKLRNSIHINMLCNF